MMTLTEKQAWAALAAGALVFAYVCANTFQGLAIPDQAARSLWRTWLAALAAGAALDAAIGWWARRERSRGALSDERDEAVLRRADAIGFGVMIAAVHVVIWQLLMERSPDPGRLVPIYDPAHPPTLFFLLWAVIWVGYSARQIAVIVLGRR